MELEIKCERTHSAQLRKENDLLRTVAFYESREKGHGMPFLLGHSKKERDFEAVI